MTLIHDKPPEQVKADALKMARRKQREGYPSCAQAYADLARCHGRAATRWSPRSAQGWLHRTFSLSKLAGHLEVEVHLANQQGRRS